MSLTRLAIIQEALGLAGRTDLVSEARLWLNLALERLYRDQDWHWLVKFSEGLPCYDGAPAPTDYQKAKVARAIVNGSTNPIEVVGIDQWATIKANGSTQGTPRYAYLDPSTKQFSFWPTPALGTTWSLGYYRFPTLPDPSSAIGDSEIPVWPENPDILIRSVYARALEYQDDSRADAELKKVEGLVALAKLNSFDSRAGRSKIKLGKSFRRRF